MQICFRTNLFQFNSIQISNGAKKLFTGVFRDHFVIEIEMVRNKLRSLSGLL